MKKFRSVFLVIFFGYFALLGILQGLMYAVEKTGKPLQLIGADYYIFGFLTLAIVACVGFIIDVATEREWKKRNKIIVLIFWATLLVLIIFFLMLPNPIGAAVVITLPLFIHIVVTSEDSQKKKKEKTKGSC